MHIKNRFKQEILDLVDDATQIRHTSRGAKILGIDFKKISEVAPDLSSDQILNIVNEHVLKEAEATCRLENAVKEATKYRITSKGAEISRIDFVKIMESFPEMSEEQILETVREHVVKGAEAAIVSKDKLEKAVRMSTKFLIDKNGKINALVNKEELRENVEREKASWESADDIEYAVKLASFNNGYGISGIFTNEEGPSVYNKQCRDVSGHRSITQQTLDSGELRL